MSIMKIPAGLIVLTILLHLPFHSHAQSKIEVEFKTGEDDLAIRPADVQGNLKVTIHYKNGAAPTTLHNANRNQTWPKNSIRRITIPLTANIDVKNLASIELLRSTTSNNIEDIGADNWDLASLTVTATQKKGTYTSKYQLLSIKGTPLHRFKAGKNCECNKTYAFSNPVLVSGTTPWIDKFAPEQKSNISAVFGNGGDDLRGGSDNAKVVILFKNSTRTLVFTNLNQSAKWENFTEKTVSGKAVASIPNVKISDIKEVQLWHTGGGGMGADNWDLDKFKLTIFINGESKILVDKVGAPLHRFTGDTRRKSFYIEH
ncbi:MAG: hypothetical protein EOO13_08980 [Chitinophagaceae bacterium]|nr:MAG: hypothetical protein EOO13_08980 [Chitinophagaceae bacterium]